MTIKCVTHPSASINPLRYICVPHLKQCSTTVPPRSCSTSTERSRWTTKVSAHPWIVFLWFHCHNWTTTTSLQTTPTTSPYASGWWTHIRRMRPCATWSPPPTWASTSACSWTTTERSICPICMTGNRWVSGVDCNFSHVWLPLPLLQSISDVLSLIQVMIITFGDSPPVFAKPKQATPYPSNRKQSPRPNLHQSMHPSLTLPRSSCSVRISPVWWCWWVWPAVSLRRWPAWSIVVRFWWISPVPPAELQQQQQQHAPVPSDGWAIPSIGH